MKKPFAYITAVWKGGEFTVIDQAAVYCRKVYEAGFTPICPVLYLPHAPLWALKSVEPFLFLPKTSRTPVISTHGRSKWDFTTKRFMYWKR